MEEEIKQDPTVASNDDSQATAPVAPAVDAESTEEAVVEPAVETSTDAATEDTAPAVEAGTDEVAEDAAPETPEAEAQPAA